MGHGTGTGLYRLRAGSGIEQQGERRKEEVEASPLSPSNPFRRAAFPLNELYIAVVLIALIAAGLYFFAGAWGVFLLWCLALVFVLPQAGGSFALFIGGREELDKGRRAVAAAYFLCALLWGLLWLAGSAFCGYRAYQAYGAIP